MSDKGFQYKPSPVPQSSAGLLDWLRREFIALSMWAQTIWDIPVSHAEPLRPRKGMVRYADGTDWDPGDGGGLYSFDGSSWVKGGGGTDDHTLLINRSSADQHPTSAITGLDAALGGKAPVTHYHIIGEIVSLTSTLAAKEPILGNPAADGYMLVSTTGGVRSWTAPDHTTLANRNSANQHTIAAITGLDTVLYSIISTKEDALGSPSVSGYTLVSTTGGARSWSPRPSSVFAASVGYGTWTITTGSDQLMTLSGATIVNSNAAFTLGSGFALAYTGAVAITVTLAFQFSRVTQQQRLNFQVRNASAVVLFQKTIFVEAPGDTTYAFQKVDVSFTWGASLSSGDTHSMYLKSEQGTFSNLTASAQVTLRRMV